MIHRAPQRYASFPSVIRLGDGRLACVFREAGEATATAALDDAHTHQDTDSRILLSIGDPSGRSWRAPTEVARSGEIALSDPSIVALRDGTWLVRAARWTLVPSRERHRLPGPIHRHYVRTGQVGMLSGNGYFVSNDEGRSWGPLDSQVTDPDWQYAVSREAPLELEDGALLQAIYGGWPETTECAAVLRSFDGGRTWGDATRLAGDRALRHAYREHPNFNEVSLVALDAEALVALIRCDTAFTTDSGTHVTEGGMGRLHWSRSDDAGMTWDQPRPTAIWGQPAHGLHLGGGRLVCTFGHRRTPFGVQAALCRVGRDGLATERRIVLRDDAGSWDCGYPCSTDLADGSILSVYYIHGADGLRHIAGTVWRLDEMERAQAA